MSDRSASPRVLLFAAAIALSSVACGAHLESDLGDTSAGAPLPAAWTIPIEPETDQGLVVAPVLFAGDGAGNSYLASLLDDGGSPVDFAGAVTCAPFAAGRAHVFVVKIDPTGARVWATCVASWSDTFAALHGLSASPAGNVALAISLQGTAEVDGATVASSGDALTTALLTLDASGTPRFTTTFGGDAAWSTAAADDGGAIVAGQLASGSEDLGVNVAGAGSTVVARFDAHGAPTWARALALGGPVGYGGPLVGVAVAPSGDVAVTGGDAIARLDASGEVAWRVGPDAATSSSLASTSVAFDARGDVVVAGSFAGSIDLGAGNLDAPHGGALVVDVGAGGTVSWQRTLAASASRDSFDVGAPETPLLFGLATSKDGRALVAMEVTTPFVFGAQRTRCRKCGVLLELGTDGSLVELEAFQARDWAAPLGVAFGPREHVVFGSFIGDALDLEGQRITATGTGERGGPTYFLAGSPDASVDDGGGS